VKQSVISRHSLGLWSLESIDYFNAHFCISEMPTISMGKLELYSFPKDSEELRLRFFLASGLHKLTCEVSKLLIS